MTITTAVATRQGTSDINNADSGAVFTTEGGAVGAAVVDLIEHQAAAPFIARLLAETAARVAAQRGGPAGLLSAGLLVADPGAFPDEPEPDGVAVVAVAHPHDNVVISWLGDSHAYGWNGTRLRRYTTPQTYGQQLRQYGAPWDVSETHNDWILTSLSHATVANITSVNCDDSLVILASDGIDTLPEDQLTELVRGHAADPQALATAIVQAVPDEDTYRDDATVIVLAR